MRDGDKPQALSFCTVSESLQHGPSAIWAHLHPILNLVRVQHPGVDTVHFWSDGPCTQYRNKHMFYLLSCHLAECFSQAVNCTWNYSEAGHGKGAPDGVGAVLKRTADRIIAHGKDISNCIDLVAELKNNIKNVHIETVTSSAIEEMEGKLKSVRGVTAFRGTMKVHQVTWAASNGRKLHFRKQSCFQCPVSTECLHFHMGTKIM